MKNYLKTIALIVGIAILIKAVLYFTAKDAVENATSAESPEETEPETEVIEVPPFLDRDMFVAL